MGVGWSSWLFGEARTPQQVLADTCATMKELARAAEREAVRIEKEAAVAERLLDIAQYQKDRAGVRRHYLAKRAAERRAADYRAQAGQLRDTQDGLSRARADTEMKIQFAKAAGAIRRVQERLPPELFTEIVKQYSVDTERMAHDLSLMRETMADARPDPDNEAADDDDDSELEALLGQMADDLLEEAPSVAKRPVAKVAPLQ